MNCHVCNSQYLTQQQDFYKCSNCGSLISINGKVIKDNKTSILAIIKGTLVIGMNIFFISLFGIKELNLAYLVIMLLMPFVIDLRSIRIIADHDYSYKKEFAIWIMYKALKGHYKSLDNGNKALIWIICINIIITSSIYCIGKLF